MPSSKGSTERACRRAGADIPLLARFAIGDAWIAAGTSAVLEVPSAIVEESNYLLAPTHPDFPRVSIGRPAPFRLDPRLLRPSRGR